MLSLPTPLNRGDEGALRRGRPAAGKSIPDPLAVSSWNNIQPLTAAAVRPYQNNRAAARSYTSPTIPVRATRGAGRFPAPTGHKRREEKKGC